MVVGVVMAGVAYNLTENSVASQVQTEQIIVAKENIPPHTKISKEMLEFQDKVISEIPGDAVKNADDIKFGDTYTGEYGFLKGTAIRSELVQSAEQSPYGSALGLKEGMVEIGLKTDLVQSAGANVKPGILVDIYAALTEEQSTRVIGKADPDLANILVKNVLNAEASEINQADANGSKVPAVVVVEVNDKQAQKLMVYQESGKIYLLPAGVRN